MAVSGSVVVAVDAEPADADQTRLHQLGYKQELKRGLSVLSNFAFSFSIIAVLAGVTTTYNTGLRYGGPASMSLGWLVVAAFNGCVALSMAEICSAYPTSGGLYYWSAKLAGKKWASLASWVTGWFNIVGQWACTTSVDFSLAQLIQVIILLGTGGANDGGYMASKMGYAFSRDGAMPFSHVWHRVNKHEVPLNVVWLSVIMAFIMALTSLGSQVAFQAMVSITTLGLYIAYALPIFFRVTTARKSFVPGPFHLGRYGIVIGWATVLWVALVTMLFSLPVAYLVEKDNFNYTPVAIGGVLLLSIGSWVFHARFWFQGPITNVDA